MSIDSARLDYVLSNKVIAITAIRSLDDRKYCAWFDLCRFGGMCCSWQSADVFYSMCFFDIFVCSYCLRITQLTPKRFRRPGYGKNKIITTMVIRPLADRTYCVRSAFPHLGLWRKQYVQGIIWKGENFLSNVLSSHLAAIWKEGSGLGLEWRQGRHVVYLSPFLSYSVGSKSVFGCPGIRWQILL